MQYHQLKTVGTNMSQFAYCVCRFNPTLVTLKKCNEHET